MPPTPNVHTATVRYDRPLVRRALNCYFARRLGRLVFVVFALLILLLAYAVVSNSWNRTLTYWLVPLLGAIATLGAAYYARLRAAEGFFDKANEPTVVLKFSTVGVETKSDLGTAELKWAVFDEVLKFTDIWLLVYAGSGYMTLPVDQLSPDCRQFIEAQMANQKKTAAT